MIFGGVTVVCGILGTIAGGFVLDFMNNTISNAFKVGAFEFRAKDLNYLP
jgi:CheY-specific phosphatase CheX